MKLFLFFGFSFHVNGYELLFADVELLKLLLGKLLDAGSCDKSVLILGSDQLQILEVCRWLADLWKRKTGMRKSPRNRKKA